MSPRCKNSTSSDPKPPKNLFVIDGDTVRIRLDDNHTTIVNRSDLIKAMSYRWRARKHHRQIYAVTTVGRVPKTATYSLHTLISGAKPGQVTHHINGNGLDNRFENLQPMSKDAHNQFHHRNSLKIKYAPVDPVTRSVSPQTPAP